MSQLLALPPVEYGNLFRGLGAGEEMAKQAGFPELAKELKRYQDEASAALVVLDPAGPKMWEEHPE